MQETYERLTLVITAFDKEDVIITSGNIENPIQGYGGDEGAYDFPSLFGG